MGKAYLGDMGIEPVLRRQPEFPEKYIGYAQSAFYGGRTSARIRKVFVPVVYTDFLSMYPTVNSLMGLWRFVIGREIKVLARWKREIRSFLSKLSPSDLFKPSTWKRMTAFVRVIPEGDILPSRSKYSVDSNDWQVALNHFTGLSKHANNALWFSLADVAASLLLTGRIPTIVDAFRLEPRGILQGLKPIRLRGDVQVNPGTQDFFKVAIEQRKVPASRTDTNDIERETR